MSNRTIRRAALKAAARQQKPEPQQQQQLEAIRSMFGSRKIFGCFEPAEFGFEFSIAEIEYCHEVLEAAHRRGDTPPSVADLLTSFRNIQKEAPAA